MPWTTFTDMVTENDVQMNDTTRINVMEEINPFASFFESGNVLGGGDMFPHEYYPDEDYKPINLGWDPIVHDSADSFGLLTLTETFYYNPTEGLTALESEMELQSEIIASSMEHDAPDETVESHFYPGLMSSAFTALSEVNALSEHQPVLHVDDGQVNVEELKRLEMEWTKNWQLETDTQCALQTVGLVGSTAWTNGRRNLRKIKRVDAKSMMEFRDRIVRMAKKLPIFQGANYIFYATKNFRMFDIVRTNSIAKSIKMFFDDQIKKLKSGEKPEATCEVMQHEIDRILVIADHFFGSEPFCGQNLRSFVSNPETKRFNNKTIKALRAALEDLLECVEFTDLERVMQETCFRKPELRERLQLAAVDILGHHTKHVMGGGGDAVFQNRIYLADENGFTQCEKCGDYKTVSLVSKVERNDVSSHKANCVGPKCGNCLTQFTTIRSYNDHLQW